METIIQQIAVELVKKVTEKAYSGGLHDIDGLATDVLQDCKEACSAVLEAICAEINVQIRQDKAGRKELGLVLKEKDRPRELLTELGRLCLPRDYYYDKDHDKHTCLLDQLIGVVPYERIGGALSARMVELATEMSYARSADIASGGKVSRQTVKNRIQKIDALEKFPESDEKKEMPELYIYADEAHAHMQKPNKEKGKCSKIVPLVTVSEGMRKEGRDRNKAIGRMHFVDENFDTKELWKGVEGYLWQAYDLSKVEKVFVYGDGGKWIKKGLEDLPQTVHVMDGYHLGKRLRSIGNKFPGRNVAFRLGKALESRDRARADEILQGLYEVATSDEEVKSISEFGTYLMENWEKVTNSKALDIPGSCTEAQISHTLSKRFSRDPLGWSEKGLGKLAKLRVYVKNGGEITAAAFKKKQDHTYCEYTDKVMEEAMSGALDWTIFDREPLIFDGASGTQTLIHGMGTVKNVLWN